MSASDSIPPNAAPALSPRGRLKVFLGYASGVGKSFRMFDEAAEQ
jgi:K+-sensing histidine kinase KdpD